MTDQTRISPKIFKLSFSLCIVKDDWLPRVWQTTPGSHLKFLSSDLVCTWSKIIDPPGMTDQTRISPKIFKFRFSLHMVKDDWPPGMTDQTRISPKMFKLSFSLCMVKDDWPPQGMTDQTRISPISFKFRFSLHMVKDDWPSRYDWPDQDLT